jgi:hypothetical protein
LEEAAAGGAPLDPGALHQLEAAAAEWARQVTAALGAGAPSAAAAHPGALAEVEHWAARAAALASLTEQLRLPRAQLVAAALRAAGSPEAAPLQRAGVAAEAALAEAADNAKFLRPMRPLLERLAAAEDFAVRDARCVCPAERTGCVRRTALTPPCRCPPAPRG